MSLASMDLSLLALHAACCMLQVLYAKNEALANWLRSFPKDIG
jgi:hypothetical protein